MTREAAAATIRTLTTRWSSPLLFNDPYDTPHQLRVTFPQESVPAVSMMIMQLIVDQPSRGMPKEPVVAEAIQAARAASDPEGRLLPLVGAAMAAGRAAEEYRRFTNGLWEIKRQVMRIFCMSELADDMLMWAHYAESHRGVVLGLRCREDATMDLCAAQPVRYTTAFPRPESDPMPWLVRYFDGNMLGDHSGEGRARDIAAALLLKHEQWRSEREWRCFGEEDYECLKIQPPHKDDLVRSVPFHPDEVEAVYLGSGMPPEAERELRRLIHDKLPETRVVRARLNATRLGLDVS